MNPELNVPESPAITQESSENPTTFPTQESTSTLKNVKVIDYYLSTHKEILSGS
jgi:hypothetical protein